ncbi:hypothetical protein [Rhodococcus wratislaviensis]|uniref:hypothetical protein n=1 Tax=Rhodococcus wratislaviensis TaxID=44752 RepID=UPI00364C64E1
MEVTVQPYNKFVQAVAPGGIAADVRVVWDDAVAAHDLPPIPVVEVDCREHSRGGLRHPS